MATALLRGSDLQMRAGGMLVIGAIYMEQRCYVSEDYIKRQGLAFAQVSCAPQMEVEQVASDITAPFQSFVGGHAAYVGIVNSMMAGRCANIGKIGIDAPGRAVRKQLRDFEVLTWIAVDPLEPTAGMLTLITPDKKRTRLYYGGAADTILADEIHPLAMSRCALAYFEARSVSNFEFCKRTMARAKSQGAKVCLSLDSVGHTQLNQNSLRYLIYHFVDYIIADIASLQALTGLSSTNEICRAMASLVQLLAFTDGQKLNYVHEGKLYCAALQYESADPYNEFALITAAITHGLRFNCSVEATAKFAFELVVKAQSHNFDIQQIDWQSLKDMAMST